MGVRAANKADLEGTREGDVVEIASLAHEEAPILGARESAADRAGLGHAAFARRRRASCTALTMLS